MRFCCGECVLGRSVRCWLESAWRGRPPTQARDSIFTINCRPFLVPAHGFFVRPCVFMAPLPGGASCVHVHVHLTSPARAIIKAPGAVCFEALSNHCPPHPRRLKHACVLRTTRRAWLAGVRGAPPRGHIDPPAAADLDHSPDTNPQPLSQLRIHTIRTDTTPAPAKACRPRRAPKSSRPSAPSATPSRRYVGCWGPFGCKHACVRVYAPCDAGTTAAAAGTDGGGIVHLNLLSDHRGGARPRTYGAGRPPGCVRERPPRTNTKRRIGRVGRSN